jgi:hypothetical protein
VLEHVVDDVFDRLVEQAEIRGLFDLTYCTDSTGSRLSPVSESSRSAALWVEFAFRSVTKLLNAVFLQEGVD